MPAGHFLRSTSNPVGQYIRSYLVEILSLLEDQQLLLNFLPTENDEQLGVLRFVVGYMTIKSSL